MNREDVVRRLVVVNDQTLYEIQILTNQVAIMAALAVLMPDKGEEQILENMLACAVNTQMLLNREPPKEGT